jgi:hypothetical protein
LLSVNFLGLDGVVSELSVADVNKDVKMEDVTEANDGSRNPNSSAGVSQTAAGAGTSRSKKQVKGITTTSGGGASSRIMADLPTAKPPAPFVIDKNQKARKWGRSSGVFQTLGGELSLPFWTSGINCPSFSGIVFRRCNCLKETKILMFVILLLYFK